jgi:site-specific DNA-methyltransferase (adenine-specific)
MKWKIQTKLISDLKEWDKNPRILSENKLKHLEESIKKFGCAEPIVINTDNTICGGHGRKKILPTKRNRQ